MNPRTKWSCPVCTYENWPASTKCTICRTPRSSALIEEEMQRLKVCPKKVDEPNVSEESEHSVACSSCTYLNKPTSFKCEQCFHVLYELAELEPAAQKPVPSVSATSPGSPSLPAESDKWSCPQCTYENWPKSKFCVMCCGPPPPFPSAALAHPPTTPSLRPQSPHYGTDLATEDIANRDSISTVARRTKLSFRDKLWLEACRAVVDGEVASIERYLLSGGRMERRLTKQECRHMDHLQSPASSTPNPCGSISLENVSPLPSEEYKIQPSGFAPISEIPFAEEPASVSSGSKFRPGLTLVDLAIRCGRTDLINLFIALSGLQATGAAVSMAATSKSGSRNSLSPCTPQGATSQLKTNQPGGRRTSGNHTNLPLQQILSRAPGISNRSGVARSKWMPCQASQHIARELRGFIASGIKYNQGEFPCAFLSEWGTFALPYSVGKFPAPVKYLLLSELCDTQAQTELEDDAKAINWWFIPGHKQASRLFALWNRTAGDCLLDSVLQACWGIFDRENVLRRTLSESLRACEASFYSRWHDYEALQAACHYILDENQCRRDWDNVLSAASQPRGALEQIHIFALSHILRRPIIVYGVKYIKNYRDEPIGIANFQGIYIPLLWDRSFCSPNPIVLGYTRGHFTALVPMEPQPLGSATNPDVQISPSASSSPFTSPRNTSSSSSRKHSPTPPDDTSISPATTVSISSAESHLMAVAESLLSGGATNASTQQTFIYLPLVDRQGVLLPIHFTTVKEASSSHTLLRDWLDVVSTRRGLPLARLRLQPRHPLVDRMMDDWLGSYRSLAKLSSTHPVSATGFPGIQSRQSSESSASSTSSSTSSSVSSLSAASENCDRSNPFDPDNSQHSQST
ncbi:hypothetical protein CRM22_005351 [Opisthorchis felineus]|uniref:ubiquitinyl hydrolase 1 n=2 Tax=Opisthorchis felineus TaxID=147828 RepID=A0A4S2LSY1_OPIFE|nr:hypothetical protein CRM22_005351 [Opisthorchis felineus]